MNIEHGKLRGYQSKAWKQLRASDPSVKHCSRGVSCHRIHFVLRAIYDDYLYPPHVRRYVAEFCFLLSAQGLTCTLFGDFKSGVNICSI